MWKMVIAIKADSQMEQLQSTEENGMHSHQMMRAYWARMSRSGHQVRRGGGQARMSRSGRQAFGHLTWQRTAGRHSLPGGIGGHRAAISSGGFAHWSGNTNGGWKPLSQRVSHNFPATKSFTSYQNSCKHETDDEAEEKANLDFTSHDCPKLFM